MKLIRKKKLLQTVAVFMAVNLLGQIIFPTVTFALTAGPGSPEFASFEPVATTDMVNVFSGDFTYNLPVVNVPGPGGGYAMSLSYHSGVSSEQEASWVGFGWTLNPGAINRSVRGVPDEYNNDVIDYYSKTRPNWTVTSRDFVALEIFSNGDQNELASSKIPAFKFGGQHQVPATSLELGKTIRFNNYQGFGFSHGITAGVSGFGSLGMTSSSSGITFSAQPNPYAFFQALKGKAKEKQEENVESYKGNLTKAEFMTSFKSYMKSSLISTAINQPFAGAAYGLLGGEAVLPTAQTGRNYGFSFGFNASFGVAAIPVGVESGKQGSFNMRYPSPKPESRKAIGYLHSTSDVAYDKDNSKNKAAVSDYYVEKPSYYDTRDMFLGIPFSSPDYFSLSGEGLSGSFRLHNSKVGTFYPYQSKSTVGNINMGLETTVGGYLSIGLNLGAGWQKTVALGKWGGKDVPAYDEDSKKFFRFAGDLGGKVEYASDESNNLLNAEVKRLPIPGIGVGKLRFPDNSDLFELKDENGKQRSSYITNENLTQFDIVNTDGIRYSYGAKNGNGATALSANESNFSVNVDADHIPYKNRYIINQPLNLYKKNGKFVVNHCEHDIINGQVKTKDYPQTYMIGEITSPDYVDVTGDGPSEDDFGGWTKFNYFKKYGNNNDEGNSDWYRWRMPYAGLTYAQNSISEIKDDIGSVSTGEKDVHYLKAIETKTHVAFMVTNKSTPARFDVADPIASAYLLGSEANNPGKFRLDGLGAHPLGTDKSSAEEASINRYPSKQNAPKLEKLEKIVLFAKTKDGLSKKPLQTTYFSYNYELVGNVPNNVNGNYPGNALEGNSGKLTLNKVWTEYEGVVSAKISPYEFKYQYKPKEDFAPEVVTQFTDLTAFFDLNDKHEYPKDQNPDYSPHLLGPWGFNRVRGEELHTKGIPWLYQGDLEENESYDPGAWQLKRIVLPTGGEILVEYEAKDYTHVQNRKAMAMVSLNSATDQMADEDAYSKFPHYDLNLEDIGIDNDDFQTAQKYASELHTYFAKSEEGNLLYFKFLYALTGNNPDLDNCQSDYVSGYARVDKVEYIDNKVRITLDGRGSGFDKDDVSYTMTPRRGCYDFYATQRFGSIEYGCESDMGRRHGTNMTRIADIKIGGCGGDGADADNEDAGSYSVREAVKNLVDIVGAVKDLAVGNISGSKRTPNGMPKKSSVCLSINPSLSFVKLPLHKPKIGGGIRVKRLLTYDPGIESGDAALYGKVYHYVTEEGESSGVATTEPGAMREENALVDFMAKKQQSWASRHIVGNDKEQSEGPIGESLLPSPTVGHERVVEENIHSGRTGSGFVVNDFHTVKTHYFDKVYQYNQNERVDFAKGKPDAGVDYSDLQKNTKKDWMVLPTGIFNYSAKKRWAAQGFRFIQHDMHGKPKSIKTYAGKLPVKIAGNNNEREFYLAQSQEYEYYKPGEEVRMLSVDENGNRNFVWDTPGKEMDITMESSKIRDQNFDFAVDVDLGILFSFPLVPIVTGAMGSFSYTQKLLATHTTSKVLNYPTIIKATKSYRDGIRTTQESLAFDQLTGRPILSATSDEYDKIKYNGDDHHGKMYTLKIPAHWYYYNINEGVGIGAKANNSGYTNQLSASAGTITGYGANGAPVFDENNLTWDLPTNIVGASVQSFARVPSWFDGEVENEYDLTASVKTELNNLYRPYESYAYKTNTVNRLADDLDKKTFEEGIYKGVFKPFNFPTQANPDPTQESEWIKLNTVTKYSPHGEPLEEQDVLGNYSAAKFGYSKTLPIMVAQNAQYEEIHFRDYEDFEFLTGTEALFGHTGKRSLKVESFRNNEPSNLLDGLPVTNKLKDNGALLKFWIKGLPVEGVAIFGGIPFFPRPADRVARVGEWELISCHIPKEDFAGLTEDFSVAISGENVNGSIEVYVDDVRFQPKNSQAACYVYDVETQRLIAQFDDQHFGLMYQYNGEGKLVRKLIETERGLRTIEETQYNVPVVDRRKNAFAQ